MDNFSKKLLSLFSMSTIYSFLKYLHYRQTQTSSGNVENIQQRHVDRLGATHFLTLRPLVWVATHTCFKNHCFKQLHV